MPCTRQTDHRVKKTRQTHCFAPHCTSGCVSSREPGQRVPLFSASKDPERFETWRRAVPRADKTLDENSALCSLHFDERYVKRHFTHVINGETVEILRDRPALTSDTVPTIWPKTPSYLSKKPPKKRQSRTSTCGLPTKIQRSEVSSSSYNDTHVEASVPERETPALEFSILPDVERCEWPSVHWSRQRITGSHNVTAFTVCALEDQNRCFEKVVVMASSSHAIKATVFVQATQVKSVELTDGKMIEDLFPEVDSLIPCKDFGEKGRVRSKLKAARKEVWHEKFQCVLPGNSPGGSSSVPEM